MYRVRLDLAHPKPLWHIPSAATNEFSQRRNCAAWEPVAAEGIVEIQDARHCEAVQYLSEQISEFNVIDTYSVVVHLHCSGQSCSSRLCPDKPEMPAKTARIIWQVPVSFHEQHSTSKPPRNGIVRHILNLYILKCTLGNGHGSSLVYKCKVIPIQNFISLLPNIYLVEYLSLTLLPPLSLAQQQVVEIHRYLKSNNREV